MHRNISRIYLANASELLQNVFCVEELLINHKHYDHYDNIDDITLHAVSNKHFF